MNPLDEIRFLEAVHRDVPVGEHLEILFRGTTIQGRDFLPLYLEALTATETGVGSWKGFRRAQRALNLVRYFESTLPLAGGRAECGVFRGFSARLLASVARLHDNGYIGANFHLVDSFEGLSAPTQADAIGMRRYKSGEQEPVYSHEAGHFATPVGHVAAALRAYPAITIHKGWIPQVFAQLPEQAWAFVHIDVDLFEPTRASLEYFFPRLVKGGVIVNDDFNSPLFPGGGRSWHEFFQARGLSYVVLDTGQAVYRMD